MGVGALGAASSDGLCVGAEAGVLAPAAETAVDADVSVARCCSNNLSRFRG